MMVSRESGWIAAPVREGLLMMSVEQGLYLSLSKVAASIWRMIEAPMSVADICAGLEQKFDVAPAMCRAEVEVFLAKLAEHKAVRLDGEAAAG